MILLPGWGCDDRIFSGLIDEAHTVKNLLIAYSMGSLEAINMACSSVDIDMLVLISGSARMVRDDGYMGLSPASIKSMIYALPKRRDEVLRNFAILAAPGNIEFERMFLSQAEGFETSELIDGLRSLLTGDKRDMLSSIKTKTLIIHGTKDEVVPPSQASFLADNINNSTLIELDGGHDIICTHATTIRESIFSLLREMV